MDNSPVTGHRCCSLGPRGILSMTTFVNAASRAENWLGGPDFVVVRRRWRYSQSDCLNLRRSQKQTPIISPSTIG